MKLYPPYIEGTIPAFYEEDEGTAKITVPFSMNKAVDQKLVTGFHMKIKTVQSNTFVLDLEETENFNFNDSSSVTFTINNQSFYNYEKINNMTEDKFISYVNNYAKTSIRLVYKSASGTTYYEVPQNAKVTDYDSGQEYYTKKRRFNIGQFYKVQIAFVDTFSEIGYYSTTAVVKFTTKPTVTIEGLKAGAVNLHRRTYVGHYSQSSVLDEEALNALKLEWAAEKDRLLVEDYTEEEYQAELHRINQEYQTKSNNISTKYRDTTEKDSAYQFFLNDDNGNVLKYSGLISSNESFGNSLNPPVNCNP